jgi:ABC-type sugar transport system substrate-binding protein
VTDRPGKLLRALCACVAAVVLLGVLGAFGTPAGVQAARARLVYFIFTGFNYPYFAPMADGVRAAAKLYPDMAIKVVSANNSSSTEISQVNEAIAAGAEGIILNPISASLTSVSQGAVSKGIPVVAIDRDVATPSARNVFIGDRDVTLGKIETDYALRYLADRHVKTPWNVAILQGTLGASTAVDRVKGTMESLAPAIASGKVKVVLNQSADFATAAAQQTISELLARSTNVQLVVCGNDAMALGAIRAIKDHGLTPGKDVYVVGADAQPQSLAAVKDGEQLDTVTHSPFLEAVWAVEAMDNYLRGVKPPAGRYPHGDVIIPMTLVTRDNVSTISDWGTPEVVPPLPYGRGKPVRAR